MMRNRILTFLFLLISTSVFAQNIDIRILRSVYSPHDLKSDQFMKFVSSSNNGMVLGIPITVGIVGLIKHDEKWINSACQIVVANAINLGATYTLKYTINRDRPFSTYPDIRNKVNETSPSFPSGHTSSAFATATSLSLAFPEMVCCCSIVYLGRDCWLLTNATWSALSGRCFGWNDYRSRQCIHHLQTE